ncbi:MAG TPA: NADH-quinone oxidoreductase subunit H [Candidatus Omnitrophota bacterium]|nr:NADH-quinone oxidoreductase subunit H [Candidatus Omnitrophota bacterium]HPD84225.1 NADH-quinone oxidoreductase subunit H [Candidatus Omnitrophota bacterium]HRZ03081.1 NADH-quinone oxidoreductase subunit H [Candidatus Omnitrophota bacterium]
MDILQQLFNIFIFPGLLFLFVFALAAEFIDRRLYARFQNRMGPPWFQPLADFIKLLAKEDIIPQEADVATFKLMPVLALTATVTSFFYIPLWNEQALFSFNGDIIVVLYLLTIPTLTYFLGGWYSRSVYSMIGAVRSLTQLFAYEVPLFMSILASALLAGTWSLSGMAVFYNDHPWYWLFNLIGFATALVALLGKLEKVPFDIPEAETEIVAGSFTEYSGRMLALFRLSINVEMVVGASLLAAVFLPFSLDGNLVLGFAIYLFKVISIVAFIALARSIFARLRLDQMINLCWRFFAPIGFLQVLINLAIKGFFLK